MTNRQPDDVLTAPAATPPATPSAPAPRAQPPHPTPAAGPAAGPGPSAPGGPPPAGPQDVGAPAEPRWDPANPPQPTAPVPGPPSRRASVEPRVPRVRMGPWAPVAGAGLGLLVGVLVVGLVLAAVPLGFAERLAAVFLCLGLALLGAGGVLLADEVRVRRRSLKPQSVEAVAGLLNGLTPARLLIGASGFVLLLAAYVTR